MAKKKKVTNRDVYDAAVTAAQKYSQVAGKAQADLVTLQIEHDKLQHKLSVLDAITSGDQMKALRLVLDGVKHKVNFSTTWVEADQPKTQPATWLYF